MENKPLLIHFHIHHRRTGVTSSVENVLPYFENYFETYVFGNKVKWHNYLSYKELKKKLKESPTAIIHAHRNNEILRALWLRLLGYQFKLVVSRHAATIPSSLTLKLMRRADERIGLIDEMKKLPFDINIIGHGVITERFCPKENITIPELKQENYIIVAGRVRPKKGHDTFIKAMIPLLEIKPDWAVVIIGKVDDQQFVKELQELIAKHKLENQVYFISEVLDIERYYQASKATVIPSLSEGFSLVCLEAMASGSITVATKDVGVHSKVIKDSETGYLFEAGNTNQLNSLLTTIVNNKQPVSTETARAYIQKHWSAQVEATALKEVYLRPTKND